MPLRRDFVDPERQYLERAPVWSSSVPRLGWADLEGGTAVVDGDRYAVNLLVGEKESWSCGLGEDFPVVFAVLVDVVGGLLKRDRLVGEVQLVDARPDLGRQAEEMGRTGCHAVSGS